MKICPLFLTVLLSATGLACGSDVVDPFDQEGHFVHIQDQQDDVLTLIEPFFIAQSSGTGIDLMLSATEDRSMRSQDDHPRRHDLNLTLDRNNLEDFEFPVRFTIDGTSIFTSSGASVYRTGPDASPTISRALFARSCLCDFSPQSGQQKLTGFIEITEYNMPIVTGIVDVQIEGELHGDHDWGINQFRFRARFDTDFELWP